MALKKILFISHDFDPQGAQRALFNAATLLKEDYNISVAGLREGELQREYKKNGINTFIISTSYKQSSLEAFDYIFINTIVLYPLFSKYEQSFLRKKCILWIHESERDVYEDIFKFDVNVFKSLRNILFVSEASLRMYSDLIRAEASSAIVYPLNLKIKKNLKQNYKNRGKYFIPKNVILISTVGVVVKRKGQDDFIKSIIPVLEMNKNVYAAIIGFNGVDLEFENHIRYLVGESGYSDRILLVDQTDDVDKWYEMSDIFAFCPYIESKPVVIFEAMLHALPIVSTSIYGIPEQITDNETGILVPAGDTLAFSEAINFMIINKDLAKKMGEKAKEVALKITSPELFKKRFIDIIEKNYES
ncbi:MAG: glycosyltransferase family 4 protein [Patescibacteria group bacterium]